MKTIVVRFSAETGKMSGGEYQYFWTDELEAGQLAVVETNGGYKVVTVIRTEDTINLANKWLVATFDAGDYKQRLLDAARAREIKRTLEIKANQIAEMKKFELLMGDTASSELIEEYKKLVGSDITLTISSDPVKRWDQDDED